MTIAMDDWSGYEMPEQPELHPAEDAEKVVRIPIAEREQYIALYQEKVNASSRGHNRKPIGPTCDSPHGPNHF
jgi:hypothetical protein